MSGGEDMSILNRKPTERTIADVTTDLRDAMARWQGIDAGIQRAVTLLMEQIRAKDAVADQILDLVCERRDLMASEVARLRK